MGSVQQNSGLSLFEGLDEGTPIVPAAPSPPSVNILTESFTGNNFQQPQNWEKSGSGTLPSLGNGALTLTNTDTNQASYVIYGQSITSASGLSISFDFYSYGGSPDPNNPNNTHNGNGISFFLTDGNQNPTIGAFGGSLGYSNNLLNGSTSPGIRGGYVGIGFDEFGDFSAPESGLLPNGKGNLGPESVAIRGSAATKYQFIDGTSVVGTPISTIDNSSPGANRTNSQRHVEIDITPQGLVSVLMSVNNDSPVTLLQNVDIKAANNGYLPSTFKFGFAAATGSATNIHEINNLSVTTTNNSPYIAPVGNFNFNNLLQSLVESGPNVVSLSYGRMYNLAHKNQGDDLINLLFNNNYYLAHNPDVAAAVSKGTFSSGLQHFMQYGQFEGRDPSILFSNSLYLSENPDVAAAISKGQFRSGFQHFETYGLEERRDLRMLSFDEGYYLANNLDVRDAVKTGQFTCGFEHYLEYGQKEGRNPSTDFNEAYYLANNPDVVKAIANKQYTSGFDHFINVGIFEGRNPSGNFNNTQYLSDNPDVSELLTSHTDPQNRLRSGVEHALEYGQYQGRAFQPQLFDEQYYLAHNPDVAEAITKKQFTNGLDHFIRFGQKENRSPSPYYNETFYLAHNSDVAAAVKQGTFDSGFEHFMMYGLAERRPGFG